MNLIWPSATLGNENGLEGTCERLIMLERVNLSA